MVERLRTCFSDRRIAVVASLAGLSLFVLAMLAARMLYTGGSGHRWLAWNLFLAWLPFLLALLLYERARVGASWRVLAPVGPPSLPLFPHPPYPLPDPKHIRYRGPGAAGFHPAVLSARAPRRVSSLRTPLLPCP